MFASAFLILVVAAVAAVVVLMVAQSRRRHRPAAPAASSPSRASTNEQSALDAELARWVAAGLLTPDQSIDIRAHERATTGVAVVPDRARAAPRRVSPSKGIPSMAEALGYLGGALVLGGLVLLVSRYWDDLTVGSRLALIGAAALLLLAGGALVRALEVSALVRLRAVLWLAAVVATVVFVVVAVRDGAGVTTVKTVVLAGSGAAALEGGLLWWGRSRPIQQLSCLAGVAVFVGAAVAEVAAPPGPSGIAVWSTGVLLVVAGLRRWIQAPVMTEAVGSVAMLVGAVMAATRWQGPGLLLLTATGFALLAAAVLWGLAPHREDRITLGSLGIGGTLLAVPQTWGFFSQDAAIATGLATYAAGVGLLYIGERRLARLPALIEIAGAAIVLAGAALTWNQWHGIAPSFGAATAVALVGIGIERDRLSLSIAGSIGLLFNVPWIINWYFPGQGRAPLLTVVCGSLILGIAVLLARTGRHRPASGANNAAPDTLPRGSSRPRSRT